MDEHKSFAEFYGCTGYFDQDAIFQILTTTRAVKLADNRGPIFMVVGETPTHLRITVNGNELSEVKLEYVNVMKPESN